MVASILFHYQAWVQLVVLWSTIIMETASRQLQLKFDSARNLFNKIGESSDKFTFIEPIQEELNATQIKFALSTSHLFINSLLGESSKAAAGIEFSRIMTSEDFINSIDRLVDKSKAYLISHGIALREECSEGKGRAKKVTHAAPMHMSKIKLSHHATMDIQRLIDMYPRGDGCTANRAVEHDICTLCGSEMIIDSSKSELRCSDAACGTVRELVGTVFDDSHFYNQDGQKAKSGTFNPNRHFQFWWTHILAREPEEELGDKDDPDNIYGEKLLERLREIIAREGHILRLLTVNDIRVMLSECDKSDLNKNVPLILKKLTGVGPPAVCDAIAVRVENLFTKAIEIGERIKREHRTNRNYYPFYIFKIIDQIITDQDTRRILYYIYIQSKDTVEADDADWEQICQEMGEIVYVPTDRTLGLQYRPL